MLNRNGYFMPLVWQLCRFGVVGLSAAMIHFSVVVWLVSMQSVPPLMANVAGFILAFQVSYWGHRQWTFRVQTEHKPAALKLLLVQGLNFSLNEALFATFLALQIPYQWALLIVLSILPAFTFILSKQWVFRYQAD